MTELTARELLIMLYHTALDAVDGHYLVYQWCNKNNRKSFTHCVAIGKAAAAMLQGAQDCLPSLHKSLLICPPSKVTRQLRKNKYTIIQVSSHPVPDELSIEAGETLLRFLSAMDENDELLFLISGGTSSLVEVPVDSISLEQLQEINQYLLFCGKDIHQINSWRQQFSKIKGGGLLRRVKTPSITQLLLSDVKGDKAEFIGSGLLVCASNFTEPDDYLSAIQLSIKSDNVETPTTMSVNVDTHIIGNIQLAMQAVHEAARLEGLSSHLHNEFIEGDAVDAANMLYLVLKEAAPGIHIWGGETTVCLPDKPGIGGRNLTLALAFSQHLAGVEGLYLLAAGTDGVDGNSHCAGAVVSKLTAQKAVKMGFNIKQEIQKANTGIVLMATDDLVQGESSNTNVMDIIIAYKQAISPSA
jgi:hydroxypyruvate reductase